MPRRSDLPLSKEDRDLFKSWLEKAEPYPDDAPELYLDATGGDPDRLAANMAAAILRQDDEERKRLGLRDDEFPEVSGGKVIRKSQ